MYFLYFGCLSIRSTRTVMDLSIEALETRPSRTRRLFRVASPWLVSVVVSVIESWRPPWRLPVLVIRGASWLSFAVT